ncbi:hypothetical protein WAK64_00515 [Bacillus spongiae]|uniref:Uncharacterized protein n=1 Tax=Bacillus spongiae TaxID=2683610 RepID=A0ABU8H8L1_9BACI
MKKIIKFLWSLLFYILPFPFTVFIIVFAPLMSLYLLEVYKLEAPRLGIGFNVIALLGFILFLSMKYYSLNWIYRKFPVLLPFFQMCFVALIVIDLSLMFANLWADGMVIGKAVAIGLSVLTILLGRAFLSYWYFKYPISNKMVRYKLDNPTELDEEEQHPEVIYHEHSHRKLVFFGTILALFLSPSLYMIIGSYSSEGNAEEVVANRISKSTLAGEIPFRDDETNAGITARDFEVTVGDSGGDAKILIWDFNSEDSDEVQILVNGEPLKEKLILANNPAAFSIPVPSMVTVMGLKDNGGGISYAVKFPNDKITYYNVVSVKAGNTYTVKPL